MNYLTALVSWTMAFAMIFYAQAEGKREAYYYHLKRLAHMIVTDLGEHKKWTKQRIYVFLVYAIACIFVEKDLLWASLLFIGAALVFPFMHDGAYYAETHKLDTTLYKDGWLDQSTTSQAEADKLSLNTVVFRIILSLIGLCLIAAVTIHHINTLQ